MCLTSVWPQGGPTYKEMACQCWERHRKGYLGSKRIMTSKTAEIANNVKRQKAKKKKDLVIKFQLKGKGKSSAGKCRTGGEHRDQVRTRHAGLGWGLRAEPVSGDLNCEDVRSRPHLGSSASGTGTRDLMLVRTPSSPTSACEGAAGRPQSLGPGQKVGEADDDFWFWAQDVGREQSLGRGSGGACEAYSLLLSVIFERPALPPPCGGDQEAEGSCYNRSHSRALLCSKAACGSHSSRVTAKEPRGPER